MAATQLPCIKIRLQVPGRVVAVKIAQVDALPAPGGHFGKLKRDLCKKLLLNLFLDLNFIVTNGNKKIRTRHW